VSVVQADAREEMPQRTPASESLLISMVEVSDLGQILPVRVVQADNHEVMIQRTSVSESLQFPMVEVTDLGPLSLGLNSMFAGVGYSESWSHGLKLSMVVSQFAWFCKGLIPACQLGVQKWLCFKRVLGVLKKLAVGRTCALRKR
jgi:hypothetical protein